jgi:hypothetical protein
MEHKGKELYCAARDGRLDEVKQLLLEGTDVNWLNGIGWTAYHKAASYGHTAVVELLLASGADMNKTNNFDHTPSHLAAFNGHLDTLKFLVSHGALFNTYNNYGKTPRDKAIHWEKREVVEYLDTVVTSIDNVRHIVCLLIGIRRGTNRQGMGALQYFPKEIVLMIAKCVWGTRRDPMWLQTNL